MTAILAIKPPSPANELVWCSDFVAQALLPVLSRSRQCSQTKKSGPQAPSPATRILRHPEQVRATRTFSPATRHPEAQGTTVTVEACSLLAREAEGSAPLLLRGYQFSMLLWHMYSCLCCDGTSFSSRISAGPERHSNLLSS